MNGMSFANRVLQTAADRLRTDRTGCSLLRYSFRWLHSRIGRVIGTMLSPHAPDPLFIPPVDKALVAIRVSGGIGDYVVIARVLRDLALANDNLQLHLFCSSPAAGAWVFGCLPCVTGVFDEVFFHTVRRQYDGAMHLNQFVTIEKAPFHLRKLTRVAPHLVRAVSHARKASARWEVYRLHHPKMDGAFGHTAVALGLSRHTFLYSQLGLVPGPLQLPLPCEDGFADELAPRFGRWLTLNNGFDANIVVASRQATKCYPTRQWEAVVQGIKQRYPNLAVIQVGGKTSVPIAGVDLNLAGTTSLAQAAAVIRRSSLHVDIEGGLVHVAASLGTRSVVLFGPTSIDFFGYRDNINLQSGFCGNCWWATERWMETCPRGYGSPVRLEELEPARVLEAIVAGLSEASSAPTPVAGRPIGSASEPCRMTRS